MEWIEPADSNDSSAEIEKHLWATANALWADAGLKAIGIFSYQNYLRHDH
ncbi:MAG: hypothetical protein ACSHX6_14135 [Akkermansiaceae bacterium]